MKRFFCLFLAAVILVSCLVLPSFAEEINYRDYETHVTVDGDHDLVTVEFPTEWIGGLIAVGNGTGIKRWWGDTLSWQVDYPSSAYQFYIAPFGTTLGAYDAAYSGRYLSLDNIPLDSVIFASFNFVAESKYDTLQWDNVMERYYTVNGDQCHMYYSFKEDLSTVGNAGYVFQTQVSPEPGDGWFPMFLFKLKSSGQNFEGDRVKITVNYFRMQMSISSLYRLQEETGRTNDLLTEVNRQLVEQGKTMDDILDQQQQTNDKLDNITGYQPTPEKPDLQDSVDDLDSIEQDALENVHTGMDDAENVFSSVFNTLGDYVQSFAAVSIIFETFSDLPFFKALLAISLSLGIVAALLGIGLDAARSSSRASKSSKSSRKGG